MDGHSAIVQRARPRISSKDPKFATILVGPKQERFVVHESLLTHYSEFFRAALTGHFREAQDKTVTLEEDDPRVFELFVHWLYYQRFPDAKSVDDKDLGQLVTSHRVVLLHIFGDKYGIEGLKRDTLDGVFHLTNRKYIRPPGHNSIQDAFQNLQVTSPLCRLIVDMHVKNGSPEGYYYFEKYNCTLFLRALWCAYANLYQASEKSGKVIKRIINLCDYHEHKDEVEKAECKAERDRKQRAMDILQDY